MTTYSTVDTKTGELIAVSTKNPNEATSSRRISKLGFMRRLSATELATIYSLEASEPQVAVWLRMFEMAEDVDLDDQDIQNGIRFFEQSGILAAGRADEILS